MKVLILAGGQGTRLGELGKQIAKPMVRICGKPVLEYQIELLAKYGFDDITLVVGYLQEQIREYFGTGDKWGVNIQYNDKNIEVGTAGRIKNLQADLVDDFFVLYGDLMFNVNLTNMLASHKKFKNIFGEKLFGTLLVQPTNHPQDCDLLNVNDGGVIDRIFSKPHPVGRKCNNLNNAAIYIFTPQILKTIETNKILDFGRDIFPKIVDEKSGILCAYKSDEYLQDMGTVDRLKEVEEDVLSGRFAKGILSVKEEVFLA
jgi:NDP-sugar pyrophosphorylase family protein